MAPVAQFRSLDFCSLRLTARGQGKGCINQTNGPFFFLYTNLAHGFFLPLILAHTLSWGQKAAAHNVAAWVVLHFQELKG